MLLVLLFAWLLLPAAALAQSLVGSYVYESPGGPVTLVLEEQGTTLVGMMTGADGTVFQLQGTIDSGRATGSISVGEGAGWFATGFVGEQLKLVVAEVDPASGQPDLDNGWNLDFVRSGTGVVQPPATGAPGASPWPTQPGQPGQPGVLGPGQPQGGPTEQGVERDPALVGLWSYSDTYNSGDFSATTRLNMQVNPDGTYLYGAGNVSLGGAYIGRSGGGDVTGGRWRTQGGIVYMMEDGNAQWTPYARYYVEGTSMMFTFGDGKRQVWHRR